MTPIAWLSDRLNDKTFCLRLNMIAQALSLTFLKVQNAVTPLKNLFLCKMKTESNKNKASQRTPLKMMRWKNQNL